LIGAGATPSDFHITIRDKSDRFLSEAYDKAHPSSFSGSANGTISSIVPGKYILQVSDVINDVTYSLKFSGNCMGNALDKSEVVIKPGDKLTCTVTAAM
jgi:hypothetical protein